MISTRWSAACQLLATGRSAETPDRMTSNQPLPTKRNRVQAFLAWAASGCGDLLNSVMVAVGDRLGIYKTGQYGVHAEDDSPSR
jgi:hypothetical protein